MGFAKAEDGALASSPSMVCGIARDHADVMAALPSNLASVPRTEVPLRPLDMVGLAALRALFRDEDPSREVMPAAADLQALGSSVMVDALASAGFGLLMVLGKGGVGKTSVAAAIAMGLVKRGQVYLTTTDPAAYNSLVVDGSLEGLMVDRIDRHVETARYVEKVMATRGRDPDEADRALMQEDLAAPCTEEVAVFPRLLAHRGRNEGHSSSWPLRRPGTRCFFWRDRCLSPPDDAGDGIDSRPDRRECQGFCVLLTGAMLPERIKGDEDFERTGGRAAEGLQAA